MPSDIMAGYGTKLAIAVVVVAAALFVLFLIARAMRNRGTSAFLRGGSNRQPRLAVLDAAAVDAHRRLVLVRRDDVEHLILIGGPTDVVVESGIGGTRRQEVRAPRVELGRTEPEPLREAEPPRTAAEAARVAVAANRSAKPAAPTRADAAPSPSHGAAAPGPAANDGRRPAPEGRLAVPADLNVAPPRAIASFDPVLSETAAAPHFGGGERARRDAEDVLDGVRDRVFGPIEPPRVTKDEPARPLTARFEDVLDARATGDLSEVTPESGPPAAKIIDRDGAPPARTDPVLDDEMARLLGDLSRKR